MMAGSETRMVGWSGGDSRDWHTEGALACSDRLTGRPPGPQQPLQASSEASGAWGRGKNLGASLLESRVAARLRSAQVALTHSLKRASCVLENKVCVFGAFLGRPSRQSAGRAPERSSRGQREWMLLVTGHGSALAEVHFEVFLRSSDLQKASARIGWEAPRTVHNDQLSSPNRQIFLLPIAKRDSDTYDGDVASNEWMCYSCLPIHSTYLCVRMFPRAHICLRVCVREGRVPTQNCHGEPPPRNRTFRELFRARRSLNILECPWA